MKSLKWIFVLLASVLLSIDVHAKTKIRFATVAPDGSSWMKEMESLNADVKLTSRGEVEFKFYPNMVMGDEKDVIRKMRLGQIQAAGFTGFGLGEIVPDIRILELPYLFNSDEEIDYVSEHVFDYYYQQFEKKGFILLGWADVGWIYFLSKKPIAEPDDVLNAKMWSWMGDPLAEGFFNALGKTPIQLSVTDVLLSLQTSLIDAVYCAPLAALALQWFTQVEYISEHPFTHSTGAVLMEKKAFLKLSEENQQVIKEQSKIHLRNLILQARKDNKEAYELIIQEGVVQTISTDEQIAKMKNAGIIVQKNLQENLYSTEALNLISRVLNDYRTMEK